jgi:putative restriction endonuclease
VDCDKWLKTLAHLRVDRSRGSAPHKPLLLLVLAGLAEEGKLTNPSIALTGELVFRFLAFWTAVAARRSQRADIRLPFYHLSSDGFWTPLDEAGNPTSDRRRAVAVRLDSEFLGCLSDPAFPDADAPRPDRDILRRSRRAGRALHVGGDAGAG